MRQPTISPWGLMPLLLALPAYTEVRVTWGSAPRRTQTWMAREKSTSGNARRFTVLDTGTEVFVDSTWLDEQGVTAVDVPALSMTVV